MLKEVVFFKNMFVVGMVYVVFRRVLLLKGLYIIDFELKVIQVLYDIIKVFQVLEFFFCLIILLIIVLKVIMIFIFYNIEGFLFYKDMCNDIGDFLNYQFYRNMVIKICLFVNIIVI